MLLNLPPLQAEARLKLDIKAAKTVAMAVVTYFICYLPAVFYAILWPDSVHSWFPFFAVFCTFFSSASNPIIYVFRNRIYRAAIRQLVKDPCRRSLFQVRPVITKKEAKKPQIKMSSRDEVGEPGASITHEAHPEREANNQRRALSQSCIRVKKAWQENDPQKTGPDWLEANEKGKGQHLTSPGLGREETNQDMNVTEKNVPGRCEDQS